MSPNKAFSIRFSENTQVQQKKSGSAVYGDRKKMAEAHSNCLKGVALAMRFAKELGQSGLVYSLMILKEVEARLSQISGENCASSPDL